MNAIQRQCLVPVLVLFSVLQACLPTARAQTLADALNPNLPWTTGGYLYTLYPNGLGWGFAPADASWVVETNTTLDGLGAQSAGPIIASGQESWIETMVTNSGHLFFWWKANLSGYSEYGNIGQGLIHRGGRLELDLNTFSNRSSFGGDWSKQVLYCDGPTNTIRWRCFDENNYASGHDVAWLDQVTFVPDPMAPQIWTQPQALQKVSETATVTFSATAIGTPPLCYQWQQDGHDLPGATNATLALTNVVLAQAGAYHVVVTNAFGTAMSANATLQVVPQMPLSRIGLWPGYERSGSESIAVSGNRAYLGNEYWNTYGAFLVLDISNPADPVLLGKLEGLAHDINHLRVVGNYVYAALNYGGLAVIDVSDPAQPSLLTTLNLGDVSDLQVVDHYLYALSTTSGLVVFDITNPAQPMLLSNLASRPCYAMGLCVVSNYAYVVGTCLAVVDVTAPTNMVLLGSVALNNPADRVQVTNQVAYVGTWRGLQLADVSDPAQPALLSGPSSSAYTVRFAGNKAYLGAGPNLLVWDISNPANPTPIGSLYLADYVENLEVVGNLVYIANYENGLSIIDVSNPAQPHLAGNYPAAASTYGVEFVGNLAFLGEGKSGLQILDVSNPAQPTPLGRYFTFSDRGPADIKVVNHLAYVPYGHAGLHILDVTDPAHPWLKGVCTNVNALEVDVAGHYAYVGGGFDGFQIVDVTDPAHPRRIPQTNLTCSVSLVKMAGQYAYLAPWYDNTLMVVDLSNPTHPVPLSTVPIGSHIYNFFIDGNRLYADSQIVDISNPTNPIVVGQYNCQGYVQCAGNTAFVADGYGLAEIDFSVPPAVQVFHTNTVGWSQAVKIAGQYAFLADNDWGLQVFQLPASFMAGPSLVPFPTHQTVWCGEDFTLAANAGGQPPIAYQWFFDGAPLPGQTNWCLSFPHIQTSATGNYTVIASNAAGSATNQTALSVIVRPDIVSSGTNAFGFEPTTGRFQLSFLSQANASYVVEYVNALTETNWLVLANITGTGLPVQIFDPAPATTSRFYRIRKQ